MLMVEIFQEQTHKNRIHLCFKVSATIREGSEIIRVPEEFTLTQENFEEWYFSVRTVKCGDSRLVLIILDVLRRDH